MPQLRSLALTLTLLLSSTMSQAADVLIYGGTPGGIAAAIGAAREGSSVTLVEPYRHIGGLITNGLCHTDFHSFEALSGTYLQETQRVQKYYRDKYGVDSPQAKGNFRGTHAEPHVNLQIFNDWLAEYPAITVHRQAVLTDVELSDDKQHIVSMTWRNADGSTTTEKASFFIDATYEGDLLAAAGAEYRVGREGREEYGESLAPEQPDGQVQGYNFRFIMTQVPENRAPIEVPPGYDREEFLPVLPLLGKTPIKTVFCDSSGGLYKAHQPPLPNGKHDINDVSRSIVRLSLPDINNGWADGDAATRADIFAEHVRHNVGLLYFLQHDPEVPEAFQREALNWGWCKDEFVDNGHLPEQLYIREARRMVGKYVFTLRDTECAPGDARAVLRKDAIAMGDYGPNCHGTSHEGSRFGGKHGGEFYKRVAPYQIPYGALLSKDRKNLLAPVPVSASHVGFCALRLEPIWMSLGEAAGTAAALAIQQQKELDDLSVTEIQQHLHAHKAATIYVADVLPDHPDFAAVQWWGTLGGLHGLHPQPKEPGERGANILGQYYQAFPGHTADLDTPLDESTRTRWDGLAKDAGVEVASLRDCKTRGEYIRTAFEQSR